MSIIDFACWTLGGLAVIGVIAWLAWEMFHAPTEVPTPLDDLLEPVAGPKVSDDEMRARVLGEPCIDPDCSNCAAPLPDEDDADAAFASAMRMINGATADEVMDPIVERIVAMVQDAVVEAEAVELDECEAEFLADPMHFGRRVQ